MSDEAVERLIESLCDRYLDGLLAEDRRARRSPASSFGEPTRLGTSWATNPEDLEEAIEDEAEALEHGRVGEHVRADGLALLATAGKELTGDALDDLLFELLRTRIVALRKIADERLGDLRGEPRNALHAPLGAPSVASTAPSPTLSALIRQYLKDGEAARTWRPRTQKIVESALRDLLNIVGDLPIREISKETVRNYHLALQRLPGRRGSSLSPSTVAQHMHRFTALMNYAVRMDLLDKNPAAGLRLTKKHASAKREVFSDEDLRAIFNADYRSATKRRPGWFWVPLLALHTGARLEELAQLHVADVTKVDGVDCIKIAEGDDRSLKTSASNRVVPIHSELVALGFLSYVAAQRKAGGKRLFSDLRKTRDHGYGQPISRWFGEWRRSHGITSDRLVFHSFRNTVISRLRSAGVPVDVIQEIVGHENTSVTIGVYAQRLPLGKLREAVEKLDVSGGLGAL